MQASVICTKKNAEDYKALLAKRENSVGYQALSLMAKNAAVLAKQEANKAEIAERRREVAKRQQGVEAAKAALGKAEDQTARQARLKGNCAPLENTFCHDPLPLPSLMLFLLTPPRESVRIPTPHTLLKKHGLSTSRSLSK